MNEVAEEVDMDMKIYVYIIEWREGGYMDMKIDVYISEWSGWEEVDVINIKN